MKMFKLPFYLTLITLVLLPVGRALAQVQFEEGVRLDPVIVDEQMEFWAELDADGNVYMDWSRYSHQEPFTYYKIVRSQTNEKPVYPQDGYIYYTDNIDVLTYTDKEVPAGTSYYRICMVAEPKTYCSGEIYKIVKKETAAKPDLILAKDVNALRTTDLKPMLIQEPAAATEEKETPPEGITNQEVRDAFLSLPVQMQRAIKAKIIAGVMPTEEELAKVPPILREEIVSQINKRNPVQKKTEAKESSSIESFFSEYWVQFLALVVSLVGVGLAVTGFTVAGRKKKKSVSKYLHQIDDTFAAFKWKSKRCEAELYRLHDLVDEQLKKGKIDEGTYQLLMNRIDKYLAEIKEIDNLPPHLKEKP